jgi:uncharacterized protein
MKPLKRLNKHDLLRNVALLFLLIPTLAVADDASHRQQVDTLFRLTQMEKKIQESVDNVLQLQLRQNPALQKNSKDLKSFLQKYIGWQAMKDDLADMYLRTFSEAELEQINAFYITPAGQKVINVVPQLVQQRNQIAMMRLQKNIGELQQIMSAAQKQ